MIGHDQPITEKTSEGRRIVREAYEGPILTEEQLNVTLIKFFREINFTSVTPAEEGCFNFVDATGDLEARFDVGFVDPKGDFKPVTIKVETGAVVEVYDFDLPWNSNSSCFGDDAKSLVLKELGYILKEIRMLYQELGYT